MPRLPGIPLTLRRTVFQLLDDEEWSHPASRWLYRGLVLLIVAQRRRRRVGDRDRHPPTLGLLAAGDRDRLCRAVHGRIRGPRSGSRSRTAPGATSIRSGVGCATWRRRWRSSICWPSCRPTWPSCCPATSCCCGRCGSCASSRSPAIRRRSPPSRSCWSTSGARSAAAATILGVALLLAAGVAAPPGGRRPAARRSARSRRRCGGRSRH